MVKKNNPQMNRQSGSTQLCSNQHEQTMLLFVDLVQKVVAGDWIYIQALFFL